MIVGSNTRSATLARLVLTTIFASFALFVAVAAVGAGNPIGLVLAVPPTYLLWIWLVDLAALVKNRGTSSLSYVARPYYAAWLASCALPVGAWLLWSMQFVR